MAASPTSRRENGAETKFTAERVRIPLGRARESDEFSKILQESGFGNDEVWGAEFALHREEVEIQAGDGAHGGVHGFQCNGSRSDRLELLNGYSTGPCVRGRCG